MEKKNKTDKINLPFYGKFQPDIILAIDEDEIVSRKIDTKNLDILKVFKVKDIDPVTETAEFLVSGKIVFSIRGNVSYNHVNILKFELDSNGDELLTCVYIREGNLGIDNWKNDELYHISKWSSNKSTCYEYIITPVKE